MGSMRSMWDLRLSLSGTGTSTWPKGKRGSLISTCCRRGPWVRELAGDDLDVQDAIREDVQFCGVGWGLLKGLR